MAITHESYKEILGETILGRARKQGSDMIMDATFKGDIQYQVGYFFDYYHTIPENRLRLEGFNPDDDPNPVPIDLKFIAHTEKTYEKDEVTMHIQFRPGQQCTVDYYSDVYASRYDADFPVGLYLWLKDEGGIYRRWLVVATADRYENQFPAWEVLRCSDVYRWVKDGKLYEFPGVARSQNSYNSGLWRDYRFQQPEDQVKFALPLNRDTEHLYYNTRLIIDAKVLTEPRAWQVSKINRDVSKGVIVFTAVQDLFNQFTDKVFLKENGDVDYWIADWSKDKIEPENAIPINDEPLSSIISKITYSGTNNQIKVGGTKTFTLSFYIDDLSVEHETGEWQFYIGDENITDQLIITYPSPNKVRIKLPNNDDLIGKILSVVNTTSDGIVSSIDVELIAL